MVEFTEPKITHYDFDIERSWFVWYRAKDPNSGEWKLFVHKKGVNRYRIKRERIKEINALRTAISHALRHENYNPFSKINESGSVTLMEYLREIHEIKSHSLRVKTMRSYLHSINVFEYWLKDIGYLNITPDRLSKKDVVMFSDYLLKTRGVSARSRNNHICFLKVYFNNLIERGAATLNPFMAAKKVQETSSTHVSYNKDDRIKIIDYMKRYDIRMYYLICFVFYCGIRKPELVLLKIGNIDLVNKTITVPSTAAKNKQSQSVTIPTAFETILQEMNISSYPNDYFVFGYGRRPNSRPLLDTDGMTASMKRINKKLGIKGKKTFYSWRHTGLIELYEATKDPYLVMRQARHSNLSTTIIYLRSLGLSVDEKIRAVDFRI